MVVRVVLRKKGASLGGLAYKKWVLYLLLFERNRMRMPHLNLASSCLSVGQEYADAIISIICIIRSLINGNQGIV